MCSTCVWESEGTCVCMGEGTCSPVARGGFGSYMYMCMGGFMCEGTCVCGEGSCVRGHVYAGKVHV